MCTSDKGTVADIVDGIPLICGFDEQVSDATRGSVSAHPGAHAASLDKVQAAFVIALHMHQPTIPAGGNNLSRPSLISNLEFMARSPSDQDRYNAVAFTWCYSRIADFVRDLAREGKNPRVMLDYSGNLLWGLRQMGKGGVLENLKAVTCDDTYSPCVEWLGTMWSHAVVPSTPVPDVMLHMRAWQHHFAALFGWNALSRVKGFSPPEMLLPKHPDVCYEYVKALKECGYRWLLVQEHSVENLDGSPLTRYQHLPHRLQARNSQGQTISIDALIKTGGPDTRLVARMQPFYEQKNSAELH